MMEESTLGMQAVAEGNAEWELARRYVEETGRNLFLTGRAGTGKTTFLQRLREESPKRMVVAAPTGVAAINAGGVTLHSFFQLPTGPLTEETLMGEGAERRMRFSKEKLGIIRGLDLLVIDEISMVRADLLDAVDGVLRRLRGREEAFGGVQLLMIGDLRQLPPVAKDEEWRVLQGTYATPYFFGSRALGRTEYRCIELQRVYRQKDGEFLRLLNEIREGRTGGGVLEALNRRVGAEAGEDAITLCSHNAQAQAINEERLARLGGAPARFAATVEGNFPENSRPTEEELVLKEGAQVMFVKNDPGKRFYNGRIGRVTGVDGAGGTVRVKCPGEAEEIEVGAMTWENLKYAADGETGEVTQKVEGTFRQVPLKLAWAITIHKSQGLTFERAVLAADRSFAPGQVYVALSRCRSLEGVSLQRPIPAAAVTVDAEINRYVDEIEARKPDAETLLADRLAYRAQVLKAAFGFKEMWRAAYGLRRLAESDGGAMAPGVAATLKGVYDAVVFDLERVAERFLPQMGEALGAWTDPDRLPEELEARLKKGAEYFLGVLREKVLEAVEGLDTEADNRQTQTALRRDLKRLEDAARVKVAGFESLAEGFEVKGYLRRTAQALFSAVGETKERRRSARRTWSGGETAEGSDLEAREERRAAREARRAAEEVAAASCPRELVDRLRAFRTATAKANGVSAFIVFSQKMLYALAAAQPADLRELERVPGFGAKRAERYGAEILRIVAEWQAEAGESLLGREEGGE